MCCKNKVVVPFFFVTSHLKIELVTVQFVLYSAL